MSAAAPEEAGSVPAVPLSGLIDACEAAGRGVIMTMGKGGVGKTTVAAAIATELARRGHPVHLTTTDPAAHVLGTIGRSGAGLRVTRIEPAAVGFLKRGAHLREGSSVMSDTCALSTGVKEEGQPLLCAAAQAAQKPAQPMAP